MVRLSTCGCSFNLTHSTRKEQTTRGKQQTFDKRAVPSGAKESDNRRRTGRGKHENRSLFYLHTLLISPLFPFLPVGRGKRKEINKKYGGPALILSSPLLSLFSGSVLAGKRTRKIRRNNT